MSIFTDGAPTERLKDFKHAPGYELNQLFIIFYQGEKMSDEKFELIEELIWAGDPPEGEDEEPAATPPPEADVEEEDPLAPLEDGDPKPISTGGGP